MNTNKGLELNCHSSVNPYEGKEFGIETYSNDDRSIKLELVGITSQEQFNAVLESIKQYNLAHANLEAEARTYKKLIIYQ